MAGTSPSPQKKDVIVTLKYGTYVAGVGSVRIVKGTTLDVVDASFLLLIKQWFHRGRWITATRQRSWIKENCVVSRVFLDAEPKQLKLTEVEECKT